MTKPSADNPSGQPLGLPLNGGLAGCYAELSVLWRTAARHYVERAAKASSIAKNTDLDSP